jgi:hypothetical protein
MLDAFNPIGFYRSCDAGADARARRCAMPPEIILYALADIVVLFMLVLFALTPAAEEPSVEPPVEDVNFQSWLMVPCWLI